MNFFWISVTWSLRVLTLASRLVAVADDGGSSTREPRALAVRRRRGPGCSVVERVDAVGECVDLVDLRGVAVLDDRLQHELRDHEQQEQHEQVDHHRDDAPAVLGRAHARWRTRRPAPARAGVRATGRAISPSSTAGTRRALEQAAASRRDGRAVDDLDVVAVDVVGLGLALLVVAATLVRVGEHVPRAVQLRRLGARVVAVLPRRVRCAARGSGRGSRRWPRPAPPRSGRSNRRSCGSDLRCSTAAPAPVRACRPHLRPGPGRARSLRSHAATLRFTLPFQDWNCSRR